MMLFCIIFGLILQKTAKINSERAPTVNKLSFGVYGDYVIG